MPKGILLPFDFRSIPGTLGQDGDPLDALVLMDEPAFCGCLVQSRLLGVIEAIQKEKNGRTERNDRLIAVAAESHTHSAIKSVTHLDPNLLKEIEHFFISYNQVHGKKFKPLGRYGPKRAKRLVEKQRTR
jgi:inorganic pyrophosphatase